jgi:MYND finger
MASSMLSNGGKSYMYEAIFGILRTDCFGLDSPASRPAYLMAAATAFAMFEVQRLLREVYSSQLAGKTTTLAHAMYVFLADSASGVAIGKSWAELMSQIHPSWHELHSNPALGEARMSRYGCDESNNVDDDDDDDDNDSKALSSPSKQTTSDMEQYAAQIAYMVTSNVEKACPPKTLAADHVIAALKTPAHAHDLSHAASFMLINFLQDADTCLLLVRSKLIDHALSMTTMKGTSLSDLPRKLYRLVAASPSGNTMRKDVAYDFSFFVDRISMMCAIKEFGDKHDLSSCAHCGAALTTSKGFCGTCRHAAYCCRDCQRQHWQEGGHSAACSLLAGKAAAYGQLPMETLDEYADLTMLL